MIKIFYNNKILLFNESRSPLLQKAKVIFSDDIVADYIKLFLTDGNDQNLEVCGVSDAEAMEFLASCVKIVNAGGGLVKDSDGRFLFIRRLGCWDLPKGWLEAGETIGECAVREVCEECGIAKNELVLGEKLTKTYHIYPYNGIFTLKATQWFDMDYVGGGNMKPQTEEDITQLRWFAVADLQEVFDNTYDNIKEVLWLKTKKLS